ncbi:MAG: hypothetical protein EXS22_01265 [Pedosphaera sp.]|nr:hypothetical protein [Pedosphaera sp.]MSU42654.1 hypothetical protein [Pedosphaera sp.]
MKPKFCWSPRLSRWTALVCAVGTLCGAWLPAQTEYQRPSDLVWKLINSRPQPRVSLSPDNKHLIIAHGLRYVDIKDLATASLSLAGLQIDPANNGPALPTHYDDLQITNLEKNATLTLRLGAGSQRFGLPVWSPDSRQFAFVRYGTTSVELWVGRPEEAQPKQVAGVKLNAAIGRPFEWMPDNTLLCQTVPATRAQPPRRVLPATGPITDETRPQKVPYNLYGESLKDSHEADLFIHYCQSDLEIVDPVKGKRTLLHSPNPDPKVQAAPKVIFNYRVSPQGHHILVERLYPPFLLRGPTRFFARSIELWDLKAKVQSISVLPSPETTPIGGVESQPRGHHWRPTAPDTLVWIEALDGGDPTKEVPHRDSIKMLELPADKTIKATVKEVVRLRHRFSQLWWGEDPQVLLVREFDGGQNLHTVWHVNPTVGSASQRELWELPAQERYKHPGFPVMRQLASGQRAMRVHQGSIFLNGAGASPSGERPFLDRFHLETRLATRLFQCGAESYETAVALLAEDGSRFITQHEEPDVYPNYFAAQANKAERKPLTHFKDTTPFLREIRKQSISYYVEQEQRTCTLYTPPGYDAQAPDKKKLPTILWVYPQEFADSNVAGQIADNARRFTSFRSSSVTLLALEGFAVVDMPLPVIGDPRTANDQFVPQIVKAAEGAIHQVVDLGVADPGRLGVGGHSYGAFAAVTLLAHTRMFHAGVARSGSYNRTLTPFGFQNERRMLWEAPETYLRMSPLLDAPKIKDPLLLIHGEEDAIAATSPDQSRQLFQAIMANGGKARLVILPMEPHTYRARESVGHAAYEMTRWFTENLKEAKTGGGGGR